MACEAAWSAAFGEAGGHLPRLKAKVSQRSWIASLTGPMPPNSRSSSPLAGSSSWSTWCSLATGDEMWMTCLQNQDVWLVVAFLPEEQLPRPEEAQGEVYDAGSAVDVLLVGPASPRSHGLGHPEVKEPLLGVNISQLLAILPHLCWR